MPSVLFSAKAMSISPESFSMRSGRGGVESGEVLHHGTYEEDGPVTWEVLVFPRVIPVLRRAGYPSPKLARLQAHVLVAKPIGRTSVCPTEVGQ
jgi:hypothetical protein